LEQLLCDITGMDAFSLHPAAGAQGELAGLLIAHAYFDSKKESAFYGELKFHEKAGLITDLELQPKFTWTVTYSHGDRKVAKKETYRADFAYTENGERRYVDVKGFKTRVYKRKKKIVEKLFDVEIIEA